MQYKLRDQIVVRGVICEVRMIFPSGAVVCPLVDCWVAGEPEFKGCMFEILDSKGRDRSGRKAFAYVQKESSKT